jgi:histidinol-phosphate aminotransferase
MNKFDIKNYVRKECRDFEPYVAGKPVETIKRELGLKKVVKLASNENPLGPSPKAVRAIKESADKVYFYPDSNSWELKQAVSRMFKLDSAQVILGSGSDELIEDIAKTFFSRGDEIVISEHAFVQYNRAGALMGCRLVKVPMVGLRHDLRGMLEAVTKRTKAVFIANPNNPTGTYNTKAEIDRFLKGLNKMGVSPLVVFDEAYFEFARVNRDYPNSVSYLESFPNLIILRTFSKIYGLAGLRVGYGFASKDVVDYINRVRLPFNVSVPAQKAAVASLADKNQVVRSVKLVKEQKMFLYNEFKKMNVPYVPSAGNFILVDVSPMKGSDVFKQLLKLGVIVRAMDEYNLPGMVRVSIGLGEENKMFIRALKKVRGV